jgi:hypothetical protein
MPPTLVFPKVFEPVRRHFGVSDRVHDIFVAHKVLKGSSVMPIVGELVASGVPQHMRVDWERELCGFPSSGNRFQETRGRCGTATLGHEDVSRFHILAA